MVSFQSVLLTGGKITRITHCKAVLSLSSRFLTWRKEIGFVHNRSSIQSRWIYLKMYRSQLESVLCLFSVFLIIIYYFTLLFSFPSLFSNFPLFSCSVFQMVCILKVLKYECTWIQLRSSSVTLLILYTELYKVCVQLNYWHM